MGYILKPGLTLLNMDIYY